MSKPGHWGQCMKQGSSKQEIYPVNLARVSGDFSCDERPEDVEATEVGRDVQFPW